MTPLSDEQLVKFFQKGDRQYFKILYQRYYQTIVNFLYQKIRDPEMAEELAQEIFLKAYKGLDGFIGGPPHEGGVLLLRIKASFMD